MSKTHTHDRREQKETRDPEDLTPHPYNARLYRQRTPNQRFIQDIAEQIEEPLVVNEDGEIIDGVRRWLAVMELDRDSIEIIEKSYPSVEAEQEAILRHNDDRDETFSQKVRVALEYEEMIAPRLEKRMKAGKPLDEQEDDPLLNSEGGATALGLAGDRVDWGKSKYRQAKQIWNAKKSGDDYARKLVRRLDDAGDDISVHGAYMELEELKERDPIPESRGGAAPREVAKREWDIDEPVRTAFPTTSYRFKQLLRKVKPLQGNPSEGEADIRFEVHEEEIQVHTVASKYSFSEEWFGGITINIDDGPLLIYVKHEDLMSRIDRLDNEIRVELRGPKDSDEASHLLLADEEKIVYFSNLSEGVSIPGPTIVRQEPLENSPLSHDSS